MKVVDTTLVIVSVVAAYDMVSFVNLSEPELRREYSGMFPFIQATPDGMVLAIPDDKQLVTIGRERSEWVDESQGQFDGQIIAQTLDKLMAFFQARISAVGGNYHFRFVCDEEVRSLLVGLLAERGMPLSDAIGGTIEACGVRLIYQRDSLRYDLRLEMLPDTENVLLARLNVHEEAGTIEQFASRMSSDMDYLKETIDSMCRITARE